MCPITRNGESVTEWDLLANYVRDSSNQYNPHPKLWYSNGRLHRYIITKERKGGLPITSQNVFHLE